MFHVYRRADSITDVMQSDHAERTNVGTPFPALPFGSTAVSEYNPGHWPGVPTENGDQSAQTIGFSTGIQPYPNGADPFKQSPFAPPIQTNVLGQVGAQASLPNLAPGLAQQFGANAYTGMIPDLSTIAGNFIPTLPDLLPHGS